MSASWEQVEAFLSAYGRPTWSPEMLMQASAYTRMVDRRHRAAWGSPAGARDKAAREAHEGHVCLHTYEGVGRPSTWAARRAAILNADLYPDVAPIYSASCAPGERSYSFVEALRDLGLLDMTRPDAPPGRIDNLTACGPAVGRASMDPLGPVAG